jgi:hypothetical protein
VSEQVGFSLQWGFRHVFNHVRQPGQFKESSHFAHLIGILLAGVHRRKRGIRLAGRTGVNEGKVFEVKMLRGRGETWPASIEMSAPQKAINQFNRVGLQETVRVSWLKLNVDAHGIEPCHLVAARTAASLAKQV